MFKSLKEAAIILFCNASLIRFFFFPEWNL